jgi:hypothetical protein
MPVNSLRVCADPGWAAGESESNFSSCRRRSREALLAGASIVALMAFVSYDEANASSPCLGTPQTISVSRDGPVTSNGGDVTVNGGVTVFGKPTGVSATSCSIGTLKNGGSILGAHGISSSAGGTGVFNSNTITTLTNNGLIHGGAGGSSGSGGGAGGAGVANSGTITTLTNSAMIGGGRGGAGGSSGG